MGPFCLLEEDFILRLYIMQRIGLMLAIGRIARMSKQLMYRHWELFCHRRFFSHYLTGAMKIHVESKLS